MTLVEEVVGAVGDDFGHVVSIVLASCRLADTNPRIMCLSLICISTNFDTQQKSYLWD